MVTKANPTELFDVEYKGLSTDEKPTDCAANSLFLELDTGKFYYFDGEAWNELGAGGGGGGDSDVLFNGSVTFAVQGQGGEQASVNTTPLEFSRTPEEGEDVYMYIDGQQIGAMSNWVYEAWEGGEEYRAMFMNGELPAANIMYDNKGSGWTCMVILGDTSIVGEKTVEIRKTPKLT